MLRLIEAEELKHILNNSKYYGTKAGNAFADMITECKTIEKRKKGKWIVDGRHPNYLLRCSACQEIAMWAGGISYIYPNFCPKCGAEMENGDERLDQ